MHDDASLLNRSDLASAAPATPPFVDPLAEDRVDDAPLLTTERRLQRLAIVAADAGARLSRDGSPLDPMAWMLAPRSLFDGERALDACQDRLPFLRATLLHGLGLGLDADPEELDALLAGDDDLDGEWDAEERLAPAPRSAPSELRLVSASVEGPLGASGRFVRAFHATCASDADVVRRRLAIRYGTAVAEGATVREGFDPADPVASSLLAPGMVRWLDELATGGFDGPIDLDVHVEQRFLP